MAMNKDSAKHCMWEVRILHGSVPHWNFTNKKTKEMKRMGKFSCILVGRDYGAYVKGTVKWDFNDDAKIVRFSKKFENNTLWQLSSRPSSTGARTR